MENTIYIQVQEGPEANERLCPDLWRPWINCKSLDVTVGLALHQHVRNRGGLLPGENPLVVRIFAVPASNINNGHPKSAFCTVFNVRPN
jgi:hypothetical protein